MIPPNIPREINIRAVLNGFIVSVGCQTFVCESTTRLVDELKAYLEKPVEREKYYRENALHREMLADQLPANPIAPPPHVEWRSERTTCPPPDTNVGHDPRR